MQVPEIEIIVTKDGAEILRKTVRPGDYVIGREPGCEVHLDVELVSRRHAQLTVNFDHVLIEDLGSSNGTFVNGQPVTEPTRLWPNQKIQVGAATVELHRLKSVPPPDVSLAPQTAAVQRLLPEDFLREKKYDIGKVVARGGMGAILDAREAAIERRVAMKVMLDGSSPDDLTRFVAEAKITGQLEHPGIVPIYELSVDENGQPFYTMKMVRGITLRKVLELLAEGVPETVKKYPLPALLTIFQKVCDALAFTHSRGVIHRDLKPENIMLDDFGVVLVMDWGLAKVLESGGHSRDCGSDAPAPAADVIRSAVRTLAPGTNGGTLAGTIMGTPQYMSPEQARGEVGALNALSDIYALGAILYHILALRPPVSGHTAMEIVDKVARGEVEPLVTGRVSPMVVGRVSPRAKAPTRVPDSLAAVVRKAMALDKSRRYPRVADLQRDIEAYQNGRATSAENAGLGKQLFLLVKRHKALFSTAFAAWLIITALAVWFVLNVTRAKKRAEDERNAATHERDRAESTLTELRGTAPTFAAQAKALVEAGKLDDALAKLRYAIQLDPKNSSYLLQRAHLVEAGQHLAEAAEGYRAVLALDPANRSAIENLALCERLEHENGSAPSLQRKLQNQLLDALLREGRAVEAGPLAAQLGVGGDAMEAALRARLKEYIAQPGWSKERFKRLPDGTFFVSLEHLNLGDLSVFQGAPISDILLANTNLKDLRPLASLPLRALDATGTYVTDLSPLRGMKLEKLILDRCHVSDLEPLRGMALRVLEIMGTDVSNLSALTGMPLEDLRLSGGNIESLAPVRRMPLRHFAMFNGQGDTDMANLAECRELEDIAIPSLAANIETLRALPKLAHLRMDGRQSFLIPAEKFWAEFKPEMETLGNLLLAWKKAGVTIGGGNYAKAMPDGTVEVGLNKNKVSDLTFLHGFPVASLFVSESKVHDLTPLRGMPLKQLRAYSTSISDLEPLRGLPLVNVHIANTLVTLVAPLQDCPTLETIVLPRGVRDVETLRHLPNLRLISYEIDNVNGLPDRTAERFWKEYDAQQKGAAK